MSYRTIISIAAAAILGIDVFVCKLRKKLANASGGKNYIETIWGRGYVMRELGQAAATIAV